MFSHSLCLSHPHTLTLSHSLTFAAVECAKVNASLVCNSAHYAIECINLTHQVPLTNSANRRVARHNTCNERTCGVWVSVEERECATGGEVGSVCGWCIPIVSFFWVNSIVFAPTRAAAAAASHPACPKTILSAEVAGTCKVSWAARCMCVCARLWVCACEHVRVCMLLLQLTSSDNNNIIKAVLLRNGSCSTEWSNCFKYKQ